MKMTRHECCKALGFGIGSDRELFSSSTFTLKLEAKSFKFPFVSSFPSSLPVLIILRHQPLDLLYPIRSNCNNLCLHIQRWPSHLPSHLSFQSGPATRGTLDIITHSLTAIFACVYTSVYFDFLSGFLKSFFFGIIAPEFVVYMAFKDRSRARACR